MHGERQLTIMVEGSGGSDVRLDDFTGQLEDLRSALVATARSIGSHLGKAHYVVVGLSHDSPATVVIEPAGDIAADAISATLANLERLQSGDTAGMDWELLEDYVPLTRRVGSRIAAVRLEHAGQSMVVSPELRSTIESVLSWGYSELGSLRGVLQAVNVHSEPAQFRIYPFAGPRWVTCSFGGELLDDVRQGLQRHVEVYGELKYRAGARHPHAIVVSRLEILAADGDLPSLSSLKGIAPNAADGESPDDYVRRLRDEWS